MKKYQIWVRAEVELDITAENEQEAIEKAEDSWYKAMQFNGDFEIGDVYCYDEGEGAND